MVRGAGKWPLVGRGEEIGLFREALERADHAGLVLAGAAGVGKTRLAAEALELARAAGLGTEWIVATGEGGAIPFGPFAHLMPEPGQVGAELLDLLRHVERALVGRAGGARFVLGVDDAHLLDGSSAALVHHLAVTRTAFVVVTLRTGMHAPDPIVSLWKDGLVERIEVAALDERDLGDLLAAALGGQIDGATRQRLWKSSQGNTLYLRELVMGGLESGALAEKDEVWSWNGALVAPRLTELIEGRLSRLAPDQREVLELLALGEPLGVGKVSKLVGREPVEAVEAAGLVTVNRHDRRMDVRLGHPLYGETLRAVLPELRARALHGMLADALEATGGRRRGDLVRRAAWRLEADGTADAGLLAEAAEAARIGFDLSLAERLARAAATAGSRAPAATALGASLDWQGRHVEAEEVMSAAAAEVADDEERFALALVRAPNLFFGLGRPAEAEAVLRDAERVIVDIDRRDILNALRAQFLLFSGHSDAALRAASTVLDRPDASDRQVVRALASAAPAMALAGRTGDARRVTDSGIAAALAWPDDVPRAIGQLFGARIVATCLAGDFAEAADISQRLYDLALTQNDHGVRAGAAAALGRAALGQGRMQTAGRWFREATALLRAYDPTGYRPFALAGLAYTSALTADMGTAGAALAESKATRSPASRVFDVELSLAEVWITAAAGEWTAARQLALAAADLAAAMGQTAMELLALHDAGRLGDWAEIVGRLTSVAAHVDGALAPALVAHARAAASRDGDALDGASQTLSLVGANLLAAEAAAEAARAHSANGQVARAAASERRANALVQQCEGAQTPALRGVGAQGPVLTRREREIAELAARGLSSKAIAERLVVSVRTVDNHLRHVYEKLGVNSRAQLADALA